MNVFPKDITYSPVRIQTNVLHFRSQSSLLFDNFKSKDTLRKNSESYYPGNYTTPMLIVCSDPGNIDPEKPLIEMDESAYVTGLIPRIKNLKTVFKVY